MRLQGGTAFAVLLWATATMAGAQGGADAGTGSGEVDYFLDLDQQLSQVKVVSASQQEEALAETPVPVTVITAEMIRNIGAKNLQDVLITYVPGMSRVEDHNELNVAMHGVYGSSQQKILILLDGHRLNSHAYSSANPDFAISLDKVRQIEVLRGPGSSLYGNIALTAVINIVTKNPKDVSGVEVRGGLGSNGEQTLNAVVGGELGHDHDLLLWGSEYSAQGEPRLIPASQDLAAVPTDHIAYLGGVGNPVSYDVGMRYHLGELTAMASARQGSHVDPFTASGVTGESYDRGAYRDFNGWGPGVTTGFNHFEVAWNHPFTDKLSLEAVGTYDTALVTAYFAMNPVNSSGTILTFTDDATGARAQVRWDEEIPGLGAGNLIAGMQLERMRVLDSSLLAVANGGLFTSGDTSDAKILQPGSEWTYSLYLQWKQRLYFPGLTANVGLRVDDKRRQSQEQVSDFSPRLALIWAPLEQFDVKLAYAQSFVDAPYFYRYNTLPSYRGAVELTPEHMRAITFTPTVRLLGGKLVNTVNVFYNALTDLVFRNNNAAPTEPIYQNAGELTTAGVEEELTFLQEWYQIRGNATGIWALASKDYGASRSQIFNTPNAMANLIIDLNPLSRWVKGTWLDLTVRMVGRQLSPLNSVFPAGNGGGPVAYVDPDNTVPAATFVNLGVRLTDLPWEGLSIDGTVYNLFDVHAQQGGSTIHPYPLPGRWYSVNLAYHFAR